MKPPTRDEVVHDMGALYLPFAFMSQAVPPTVSRRFLASLRALLEAQLEELERYHARANRTMPPSGRLVFEHGMNEIRRTVAWCAHCGKSLFTSKSGRASRGGVS